MAKYRIELVITTTRDPKAVQQLFYKFAQKVGTTSSIRVDILGKGGAVRAKRAKQIIWQLKKKNGQTARELNRNSGVAASTTYKSAMRLADKGRIVASPGDDGVMRFYLTKPSG